MRFTSGLSVAIGGFGLPIAASVVKLQPNESSDSLKDELAPASVFAQLVSSAVSTSTTEPTVPAATVLDDDSSSPVVSLQIPPSASGGSLDDELIHEVPLELGGDGLKQSYKELHELVDRQLPQSPVRTSNRIFKNAVEKVMFMTLFTPERIAHAKDNMVSEKSYGDLITALGGDGSLYKSFGSAAVHVDDGIFYDDDEEEKSDLIAAPVDPTASESAAAAVLSEELPVLEKLESDFQVALDGIQAGTDTRVDPLLIHSVHMLYADVVQKTRKSKSEDKVKKALEQLHYRTLVWLAHETSPEETVENVQKLMFVIRTIRENPQVKAASRVALLSVASAAGPAGGAVLGVLESIPQEDVDVAVEVGLNCLFRGLSACVRFCCGIGGPTDSTNTAVPQLDFTPQPASLSEIALTPVTPIERAPAPVDEFKSFWGEQMRIIDQFLVQCGEIVSCPEQELSTKVSSLRSEFVMTFIELTRGLVLNAPTEFDSRPAQVQLLIVSNALNGEINPHNKFSVYTQIADALKDFRTALKNARKNNMVTV
jgi:hypothetical protein